MAGYDNIKDHGFDKLTAERQREIASMGGKASQKAAKKRKTMREIFRQVGELNVTDKTLRDKLTRLGIPEDDITWQVAVAVSTIMNAIKKNDIKTVAFVLQMFDDETEKDKNPFEEFIK